MTDRSTKRIDAMLAFLGGRSEASPAGVTSARDIECRIAHRGCDDEAGASRPLLQGPFISAIVATRAAG